MQKYNQRNKQNFINDLFEPKVFSEEDLINHPPEDIYITPEIAEDSIKLDQPFEDFVPTIELHFDKPLDDVNLNELQQFIGDDGAIIGVREGSIFIKLTFLKKFGEKITNISATIKEKFSLFINKIKAKFNTSIGKDLVGNLENDQTETVTFPDEEKIKELYSKPSMNMLQNTQEFNELEIDDFMYQVIEKAEKTKTKKKWLHILSKSDAFKKAEEQVRNDITNNPFEMIIVGQTLIANKHDDDYEKIKSIMCNENYDFEEKFLYHGSRLANHEKIVKKHFLMPGQDKMGKITDPGYYGKGIYATENLYYASLYGNGYQLLQDNQKTSIVFCRAIYNKSKVLELHDLSLAGQKINKKIADDYGIHHAYVGNSVNFTPVDPCEKENNDIFAEEYVFPNKYQIIPIYSFMIMKADHYILWKDENLEGSENSSYLKELSQRIEVNVYGKSSYEEAIEVIKLKKHNKVKLITNGGQGLTGKKLIEKSRDIIGSNFVCLVFAGTLEHMSWVENMENVLLTTDTDAFKKFAELKMNQTDVLDYIKYLENLHSLKFKIKEDSLLKFPLAEKKIRYKD